MVRANPCRCVSVWLLVKEKAVVSVHLDILTVFAVRLRLRQRYWKFHRRQQKLHRRRQLLILISAKKGLTPSQIGVILRDSHGIPQVKSVTGSKILRILKAHAIEPKVVHRDIKASNILIDDEFNAKLSDFGLAKLLDSGESHINTRVMGTFGYVAPEYANSGLLNEKSDIYSFGILLLEAITGRDPVDYDRPANEVNLVEWLKMMVGTRRAEEVVDPRIEPIPATRALKRSLLVALRCVDPEAEKRPKMSHVVRMLESDDNPFRESGGVERVEQRVWRLSRQQRNQMAQANVLRTTLQSLRRLMNRKYAADGPCETI